jgi:hypothetical protein
MFVLFLAVCVSAQTYQDEKKMVNSTSLESSNAQLNFLSKTSSTQSFNINKGNSVLIDQVGQGNISKVLVVSDDSEIKILQDGFQNKSFIFLRADMIRENVQQIGNNNLFLDYSLHGAKSHKVDLIQNGSYNEVISVGNNSLSERLQLKQTGIGKTALIIHNQ